MLLRWRGDRGLWGLPGGALELGDSVEEAVIRNAPADWLAGWTRRRVSLRVGSRDVALREGKRHRAAGDTQIAGRTRWEKAAAACA